MRKYLKYRKFGNGFYEYFLTVDFAGEYIGIHDIHGEPIYEGDKVKAYDELLKDTIMGVITYVAPSFCVTCGGYNQPLYNVNNIEII